MHKSAKLVLTALGAALLLASAVGTASARSLSVSNQSVRATWNSLEFTGGAQVLRCPVTLEGSFHTRTIAKVARSLIGYITRANVNQGACTNGIGAAFNGTERYNRGTPANTLPWHITYESFAGTLPGITSIRILLRAFRFGVEVGGAFGCTAQYGAATDNISADAAREAGGAITSLTPVNGLNNTTLIRTDNDPFGLCPNPGRLAGATNSVTLLGATTRITITLI